MILSQLKIGEFGALRHKVWNFTDGIQMIVAPNEAGKTTMCKAIDAALYGLSETTAKRKKLTGDYQRYLSGDMTLELCFTHKEKAYVLTRNLRDGKAELTDTAGNSLMGETTYRNHIPVFGIDFLGVDSEVYRKYYDIDTHPSQTVDHAAFLTYLRDGANARIFRKAFENAHRKRQEIGSLRAPTKRRASLYAELEALQKTRERLVSDVLEARTQIEALDRLEKAYVEQSARREELAREEKVLRESLERDYNTLTQQKAYARPDQRTPAYPGGNRVVRSAIFGAVAFFLSFFLLPRDLMGRWHVWLSAFFGLIGLGLAHWIKGSTEGRVPSEEDLPTGDLIVSVSQREQAALRLRKELHALDASLRQCIEDKAYLEGRTHHLMEAVDADQDAQARMSVISEALQKAHQEDRMYQQAMVILEKLQKSAEEDLSAEIFARASRMFSYITDAEVEFAEGFQAFLRRNGRFGVERFSAGTLEVLHFCLKFSFHLAFTEEDFVLFDDPFLYVDDRRLEKIADIFSEWSDRKQIFFFLSNRRLLEIFRRRSIIRNEVNF